ncbi:hypothetical protein RKD27_004382 [Streptomyces sp. SAI-126]|uniref:hypothetical protein n=1 Tax=Streptomyces sp. SAI-126 TaxID=3377732 RepID=UPI003C7CF2BF
MSTVWPGTTTSAAACTEQNGTSCVPGPVSLHQSTFCTYNVPGCPVSAAAAGAPARAPTTTSVLAAKVTRRDVPTIPPVDRMS